MISIRPVMSGGTRVRRLWKLAFATVLLPAAFLMGSQTASAQQTIVGECMQDIAGFNLGCTANDVRVSGVADVTGDGIVDEDDITFAAICDAGALNAGADCSADPNICLDSNSNPAPAFCGDKCAFPGDTTSFSATFEVLLSAQERYDIGLYFAIDGDPNGDGALTGVDATSCSVSTLPESGMFTRPDGSMGNFVDLDIDCNGGKCPQPEDTCGDIDNANNPIFYDLSAFMQFVTTECIDPDANGQLNLPNCTSWRQSGANEVCFGPVDAFPGSPSKCNCDPGFEVPINVPPAELQVVKTATPTTVDEPGDTVQFDIAVTNTGVDPNNNVTLNSLSDDVYGDITQVQGDILSTTCSVPQTITPGGTYTCSFDATVSGNGGDSETDTVTASGVDDNGNPVEGEDDAVVDIIDVLPAISVDKTANPTTVLEGAQELVTFMVVVDNDSVADPLTLTSLTDDIHGDLNGQGDCSVPQTIALNGSYSCTFTAIVDGQAFTSETDTVTAVGEDDENPANEVMDTDSATVTILDDVAMIELIKTANPTSFNEPSADVTYTFTVNNLSNVDTVTINSLTDTIYGDLTMVAGTTCAVPQDLVPTTGTYTCSITVEVAGDAGDSVLNVATAAGVDDDGQPVMASDDATVNILDVPPAASLTKTATMVVVTYDVVVTNDSAAEELFLDALGDDTFGDITVADGMTILSTTCTVPQTIAVGGSYSCSFDAKVSTSPHTNTVTGTVSDNENTVITPSDSATVTFD